jgi:hypothetical protein
MLLDKEMAEEEGFEPPIPFQVRQFSRLEPSTTRPLFRHPIINQPGFRRGAPSHNTVCRWLKECASSTAGAGGVALQFRDVSARRTARM